MPDPASPKAHIHPFKRPRDASTDDVVAHRASVRYAELAVTSNFSFLRGASHPDELAIQAATLGYHAIAITDRNSLAGVVRAHIAAKDARIRLIVGCRLVFQDVHWLSLLVYPMNRAAYGRLCQLLTLGKRRAPKGECHLTLNDVREYQEGLLAVTVLSDPMTTDTASTLGELRRVFDADRLSLAIQRLYGQDDRERLEALEALARRCQVPLVVTNDAHYHVADRKPLQDVLTCIREGCTIDTAGFRLFANAERHLKAPDEMARLFASWPEAIDHTVEIANRASGFTLDELRYEYPDEVCPAGQTPMQHLENLTWQGAAQLYSDGVPDKVQAQIRHEFTLIGELEYAPYFLTVHDIVRFARSRGILCQGRGAAANSAVCFCLGVTSVDPARIDVLFERFVSRERNEPPDIDIDFEHERREEVIQYLYAKYGRDRAGLTAVVTSYRGRSAIRDVGKALGLSLDTVDQIAKQVSHWDDDPFDGDDRAIRKARFDSDNVLIQHLVRLVRELVGFPRHLSQHVGGFVITRGPLCELVPIENAAMEDRTVIEWDKDDIDAMNMLKVDVLGLGMLTCIRKGLNLIEEHHDRALTLASIPSEDSAVYDMICKSDTLGVFQIESRAQMTMLPRLKPRCFYDLVIEVAIVRPGPIVGDLVHPYLRRRNGEEEPYYPDEKVRRVLQKTLGVPLFQEQAMSLAIVAAGFTPGEAEKLRRTISAWKTRGKDAIPRYQTRFIDGMLSNGYERKFAEQCFERLKGFSEYGFPESHAASFALLVYASAWIKCYYPAVFAAALINSQPMGFYADAQIVRDAQEHGVKIRPVDVNHSQWDCTLEESGRVVRLGLRMVRGLREVHVRAIVDVIAHAPARSMLDLWRRSGVSATALRPLALADAFGSIGLSRQRALWELQQLHGDPLPLFDEQSFDNAAIKSDCARDECSADIESLAILPPIAESTELVSDYRAVGLSLKKHPMDFLREGLTQRNVLTIAQIRDEVHSQHGRQVAVAGVVLVRQRPGTAKGVMFMTIEDETGRLDLIVRQRIYERDRSAAIHSQFIVAHGRVERNGLVVHVLPSRIESIADDVNAFPQTSRDFH